MNEIDLKYKQSRIGIIPSDWNIARIEDIADVDKNSLNSKTEPNYKFKYISLSDVNEGKVNSNLVTYTFKNAPSRARRIVEKNDILMSTVRPNLKGFAYLKFFILDTIASTGFAVLSCKENYCPEFLYYNLFSHNIESQIFGLVVGSNYPAINSSEVRSLKIPVPPLKEQEKIAEILSTWDLAIEKQEQLIEKKKDFKKGLMQRLYAKGTKKEKLVKSKLGEIPENWDVIKAKEVFTNVSIKNNENEELLSVTQDKGTIPRSQLEGNVVMPDGNTNGYKLVVPNNFIISLRSFQGGLEISKHRGIISPAYTVLENRINICHDYFKYYFKKEEFISRLNGVIVGIRDGKQISYADFGEMFLPVPPIEEQRKIAEILTLADKEIELLEKELEALKLQKKGLMQRLLTGEVRVKV